MQRAAVFEAVLCPNASLTPRGLATLALGVSLVLGTAALGFMAVGAWPVSGFLSLSAVGTVTALGIARRAGRRREHIRLDAQGLRVRCVEPGGATQDWRFEPYWVRVRLDEQHRRAGRLVLSAAGQRLRIGAFLTPAERRSLALALDDALAGYR